MSEELMIPNTPQVHLVARNPVEMQDKLKDYLLNSVVVENNGCWVWQKGLNSDGYGRITIGREKRVYAHRLSFQLFVRPLKKNEKALHKCDNPPCINPDHLFAGSQTDNMLDMRRKGRGAKPPIHVGESHPKVSISDEQVAEAIALRGSGLSQRAVAAQFGVSQATVWNWLHHYTRTRKEA